mmetsp:Transcript_29657/g.48937  ORF Transcript_29657/g.48937 Transcript_29657/m.48937 type:complete len:141 (-) Transcript_29657:441-863(-)
MGGPIGRFLSWTVNFVWWYFMKEGFVQRRSPRELDMYRAPFIDKRNRRQTSVFPRQLVQSYAFEADVEAAIDRLATKDVLLLWGTKDFAFQEAERDRFMKIFPKHTYCPLDASHFWQDERGEEAVKHIIDWAEQNMLLPK